MRKIYLFIFAMGLATYQRSDFWSPGVLMYEMLSGHLPFEKDNDQKLIYSILKNEPRHLSKSRDDLAAGLKDLVNKTLRKNPFKVRVIIPVSAGYLKRSIIISLINIGVI